MEGVADCLVGVTTLAFQQAGFRRFALRGATVRPAPRQSPAPEPIKSCLTSVRSRTPYRPPCVHPRGTSTTVERSTDRPRDVDDAPRRSVPAHRWRAADAPRDRRRTILSPGWKSAWPEGWLRGLQAPSARVSLGQNTGPVGSSHTHTRRRGVRGSNRARHDASRTVSSGECTQVLRCKVRSSPPSPSPLSPYHSAYLRTLARVKKALPDCWLRVHFFICFVCAESLFFFPTSESTDCEDRGRRFRGNTTPKSNCGERRRDCVSPGDCHRRCVIVYLWWSSTVTKFSFERFRDNPSWRGWLARRGYALIILSNIFYRYAFVSMVTRYVHFK